MNIQFTKTAIVLCCSALLLAAQSFSQDFMPAHRGRPAGSNIQFYPPIVVSSPKAVMSGDGSQRCPDSNEPCFKDNKDILNGQRNMMRIDDLAIVGAFVFPDGVRAQIYSVATVNSTLGSVVSFDSFDWETSFTSAPNVTGGRFFNSPGAATAHSICMSGGCLVYSDTLQSVGDLQKLPSDLTNPTRQISAVVADFTGDSFDDILYFTGSAAVVATAVDVNNPYSGFRFGPLNLGLKSESLFLTGLAAGRFRGQLEVAALSRPGNAAQAGLNLSFLSVDPKTLAISVKGPQTLSATSNKVTSASLIAGHFNTVNYDQLAIAYQQEGGLTYFFGIDFDSNGNITSKTPTQFGDYPGNILIRHARFDPQSPFDQAATMFWSGRAAEGFAIGVLGFDDQMNVVGANTGMSDLTPQCVYDMQAGNFDRTQLDPSDPTKRVHNAAMQIAVATGFSSCGPDGVKLSIWNVTGNQKSGWTLTKDVSTKKVPVTEYAGSAIPTSIDGLSIAAVDLQGRSLVLGEPTIVTIENRSQPSVILASPPMHVDYIVPVGDSDQKLFNFTGAPGGFFTSFQTSDNSDTNSSTTNSTTWSFAATETASYGYHVGDCELGDCASVDAKLSAKQALDGSKSTLHGTFDTTNVQIAAETGFADTVFYTSSTLTSYVYPVLGKKVCPTAKPNCSDSEKVQTSVQFAGPDTVNKTHADGLQLSWYQPSWMPGNILSYPGNLEQLKASAFTDPTTFQQLTDANRWFTDSGDASSQATWTTGNKDGSTSSFNQNYSFESDISLSMTAGVGFISTESASFGLDLSGSFGFSNLTDSTTTLTKSTGIGFTKKATFANAGEYGYWITPYIFGQKQPGGVVDDKPLATDVQTFGILQTGHIVDPLASGAGAFWSGWYTKGIDIGLNQPARWQVGSSTTNPNNGSCLVFDNASSNVDCATAGLKQPNDPWRDEFHWMRGFFISKVSANGNAGGPQIGQATAGDQLLLRARIHNFSLAKMPDGATVHVRFYGMPLNAYDHSPAGPSFLIGEQKAPQLIPPFNTDTNYPNWVLVSQTFDTTRYENEDLVFWVIVWAQDAGGKMIGDLPGHGLKSIPPATADYAEVVALEEEYGNNIGLFHQVFHIFSPQSPTAAASTFEIAAHITQVGVERNRMTLSQPNVIAAKVATGSSDLKSGFALVFYDGNPRNGGKRIGTEWLPFLRARRFYDFRVAFRPRTLGSHEVFIVAGEGTKHEHIVKTNPIQVVANQTGQRIR